MGLTDAVSARCFSFVHGQQLVYNACWEDPRLDREALSLGANDTLLTITSAGCNALDYLLDEPRRVYAVDVNYRQNALLELKVAGIRWLNYETYFELFGRGKLPGVRRLYEQTMRVDLSPSSQAYWDRHIDFFAGSGRRPSFYYRGTTGYFAWMVNRYLDRIAKVRPHVEAILSAATVAEQQSVYEGIREAVWRSSVQWLLRRDSALSLLGVPRPQRQQIDRDYPGGIARFVADAVETVFARLPLADNYFWRVYLTGSYTPECCPEYLKPENFSRLKNGLIDRLRIHTGSICNFLERDQRHFSRFVLLDHMDWLSAHDTKLLARQWQALVARATPDARILWRSAGTQCHHLDRLPIQVSGCGRELGELLRYDRPMAERLHALDRVHTYGSFYIAQLAA